MAKHMVKCANCGIKFDANEIEYIMINSRRYAHKICPTLSNTELTQEELESLELNKLKNYIKELFGNELNWGSIQKDINTYKNEYSYTYSGMRGTLYYFYEIKRHSKEKANGGIRIIPYIYKEAKDYFTRIQKAKEANENIKEPIQPVKEIEVIIQQPKRKTRNKNKFAFLDMEEE